LIAVLYVKQNLVLAVPICLHEHVFQRLTMPVMNHGLWQQLQLEAGELNAPRIVNIRHAQQRLIELANPHVYPSGNTQSVTGGRGHISKDNWYTVIGWDIPQFPQPLLIQPLVIELTHDNVKLAKRFSDAGDPSVSHLVIHVAKGEAITLCL